MPQNNPPYQITNVEIASPDDALAKLFAANRERDRAERAYDGAKAELKAAKEYQAALLSYVDQYHLARREQLTRQGMLDEGFRAEPLPPWMIPGADPDKPPDKGYDGV